MLTIHDREVNIEAKIPGSHTIVSYQAKKVMVSGTRVVAVELERIQLK